MQHATTSLPSQLRECEQGIGRLLEVFEIRLKPRLVVQPSLVLLLLTIWPCSSNLIAIAVIAIVDCFGVLRDNACNDAVIDNDLYNRIPDQGPWYDMHPDS